MLATHRPSVHGTDWTVTTSVTSLIQEGLFYMKNTLLIFVLLFLYLLKLTMDCTSVLDIINLEILPTLSLKNLL